VAADVHLNVAIILDIHIRLRHAGVLFAVLRQILDQLGRRRWSLAAEY
jgi:hypothetical protein